MESGFIAIYKDEKLPLILALGITDNVLCWTRLAKSLELEYDIIIIDARGHGVLRYRTKGVGNRITRRTWRN